MTLDHDAEQYDGSARILGDPGEATVTVRLRGAFQPIDGRYHWYGRVWPDALLEAMGAGSTVTIRTTTGEASGRISDPDPWGRFRIAGTGRPPF